MWSSLVIRESAGLERRNPRAAGAWGRLLAEVEAAPDAALISHEFLGAASAEQAKRAIADLGDVEVHVIVTARDLLSVLTSYWQEYVKHGFDATLDEFPTTDELGNEWGWAAVDLLGVLERWGASVPPERVHLVVLPEPGAPRDALVRRFAEVMGVDARGFDLEEAKPNSSLGVVEAELLRRLSPRLQGFTGALDRGVWIRSYLAHQVLLPRGGDAFLPTADRVAELAARADAAVEAVRAGGYDVVGDVERLRVGRPPDLRHPADVTESELLDAALDSMATMMGDLREIRRDNTRMQRELAAPPGRWERLGERLRRLDPRR
jgi:hypothetical protein